MRIEQFVDEGLGNTTHLVCSEQANVAAVIDPLRDVDVYLAAADALGVRLTHVFETHVHNDFISGSRELAARTGAQVCSSAAGDLAWPHRALREGDEILAGDIQLTVLATPGHTPEHVSYLARDTAAPAQAAALFSGGSLLVGAVSRTDLLGREHAAAFARQLYRSLHEKILRLPDETRVYPTHGAGSFCTAAPGAARRTTIGQERRTNPLLPLDGERFVAAVLQSMPSYPTYFHFMRAINRQGPPPLGKLPALPPLSPQEVQARMAEGAAVVDLRPVARYLAGHIPGVYHVALRPSFGSWVGWVVPFGTPLILVAEAEAAPGVPEAAVRQLIRIGYDHLLGYLAGGLAAWQAAGLPVARLRAMAVEAVWQALSDQSVPPGEAARGGGHADGLVVLDVRQDAEWAAGHIPGARHVEAGALVERGCDLPANRPIAAHCGHEERAATALSVLARLGGRDLRLIRGGWAAWEAAGLPVVQGVGYVGGAESRMETAAVPEPRAAHV